MLPTLLLCEFFSPSSVLRIIYTRSLWIGRISTRNRKPTAANPSRRVFIFGMATQPPPHPCQLDLHGQNNFSPAWQLNFNPIGFLLSLFYTGCHFVIGKIIKIIKFLGGPHIHDPSEPPRASAIPLDLGHCVVSSKMSSSSNTSESRRQFLSSTLGPLTACVTMGVAHNDDYYYHLSNHHSQPGELL